MDQIGVIDDTKCPHCGMERQTLKGEVEDVKQEVFTDADRKIMREHKVPYDVAYHRYKNSKWDKHRAITEPLRYGKGRRKQNTKMELN